MAREGEEEGISRSNTSYEPRNSTHDVSLGWLLGGVTSFIDEQSALLKSEASEELLQVSSVIDTAREPARGQRGVVDANEECASLACRCVALRTGHSGGVGHHACTVGC